MGVRARTAAALATPYVLLLLSTGCSDDVETATEEPNERNGVGSLLSSEEAEAALPVASDLPAGWEDDPDKSAASDELSGRTTEPAECAALLSLIALQPDNAAVDALASFVNRDEGTYLGVAVASYPSGEPDVVGYEAARDLVGRCGSFLTDEEGATYEYRASLRSFAEFGDSTFAMRLSIPHEVYPFTAERVAVNVDNHVVGVIGFSWGETLDVDLIEQVTRVTVKNLDDL